MEAFRAPGFVEGTFGLECLLDELAASSTSTRSSSAAGTTPTRTARRPPVLRKNLMECYRRAEPHWERRHEVRARSDDTWKRGVGLASQIWYGGGGPPCTRGCASAPTDARTSSRRCRTSAPGTRTAMAQIAAEELGLPLERVERRRSATRRAGRTRRSPAARRRCLDGPRRTRGRGRRGAADPRDRRAALRASRTASSRSRAATSSPRTAAPGRSRSSPGCSRTARSSARARAGRTRPACACSPSACRWRRSRSTSRPARSSSSGSPPIHDVGRVINPLGARSQVEGGIIQGSGTRSPRSACSTRDTRDDPHADARRVQAADDRRRARDRLRAHRRARPAADEPRLEGPRRAADRPDRRRDRERDPRRHRRRRALAADHARGDPCSALRGGASVRRRRVGAAAA